MDSPVIVGDDDYEEYFSPVDEDTRLKDSMSATKRFATNFTASGEEMIDLTVDSSTASSGAQTPEQSSYPHIKLLDFLSPGVSPKELAISIKKQSKTPSQLSVAEAAPADSGVVSHYGVTARSPVSNNEPVTPAVRQISPPQKPDELKRAALLPPNKRLTTPINANVLSSAPVSIHSPTSALTTSITKGTVSVRKHKQLNQLTQASHNISSTMATTGSELDQQYKFSPPVAVTSTDKTSGGQVTIKGATQRSPNVSFPFSPPLTRSQRRKTIEQESVKESSSSKVKLFTEMAVKGNEAQLFTETTSEVDVDPSMNVPMDDESKEIGKKKLRVSTSEVTTTGRRKYQTRYELSLS